MNNRADDIERLVDGELSADEYRELLAALDDEPGGWRRCALTFIEAQALTHDLRSIRSLSAGKPTHGGGATPSSSRSLDKTGVLLAIAASFLIAFGLGVAAPSILRLARQESIGGGNINGQPSLVATDNADDDAPDPALRYVGDVRLLVAGDAEGSQEAGRVPVYDVGQDVNRYLSHEPPVLGPEMIDLLRQHGYDVQHKQQFFPAPLEDGRQIIVPVDGYQITPVSRRY